MRRARWLPLVLVVLVVASRAHAQQIVKPTQISNPSNQEVTSAAGAAVSVTLTPGTRSQVRLYALSARCSAGTAAITITDGGIQRWSTDGGFVTTAQSGSSWTPVPYTGRLGSTVVVTLGSCGGGNVGTLNLQADIY